VGEVVVPAFETPDPIFVAIDLGVGTVRISATERSDTLVDVRPSNPAKEGDVTAAQETRVDFGGGRLTIAAPRGWRQWLPFGGGASVDVEIELPAGSRLAADAGVAPLRCTGRLEECRFKTGYGDVFVEDAGSVALRTGAGAVSVDSVAGRAEISTGSGDVQVGAVGGAATVKNGNGATWIGEADGDLRVQAANGSIVLDRSRGKAALKSAHGDVSVKAVEHGEVVAETAHGKIEVGVVEGIAAWLDLSTGWGVVTNELDSTDGPPAGGAAVEIRANTAHGDVRVRRAVPA
jgi:hypothetical protein